MSTTAVDSRIGSLQHVDSRWDEGEFSDSISQYDVERIDSRVCWEDQRKQCSNSSLFPLSQSHGDLPEPILYEKLKLKVTTCTGQFFEKELIVSTCFTACNAKKKSEESLKLQFDRFSKETEQPSDFYSLKKDILEKLKNRTSKYLIDECRLVRQKYLNELFAKK